MSILSLKIYMPINIFFQFFFLELDFLEYDQRHICERCIKFEISEWFLHLFFGLAPKERGIGYPGW